MAKCKITKRREEGLHNHEETLRIARMLLMFIMNDEEPLSIERGDNENDEPTGHFGKIVYPDGNVYEGFLKNNDRHGRGKMTNSNGVVTEEGLYKCGKLHIQYLDSGML